MLVARFDTDQPPTCGARAARRATARVSAAVRAAAPESRSRRAHKAAAGTLAIGRAQFRPSNRFQVITFFQPRFRRFFAISKILSAPNTKPNLGNPRNRPGLNPIASPWLQRFDLNHLRKKSINWGRYSDPVARQKSVRRIARGENFPDLDWGGVLAVSGNTIASE